MRLGFNPNRDKHISQSDYFHQVVIPVYIPNLEGYFKDSFNILKLCITSLLKTSHSKTYITIVNNGSCELILDYLNGLHKQNKIQELIHVTNIGYINAMLKGIAGQNFEIITTSDADVLFLDGWQDASYNLFQNFSKCGAVCTTPSPRSLRTYTANLYWDFLFSKKIKPQNVLNQDALQKFATSVGNIDFYNENQLKKNLIISNNGQTAVVGAGHFIVTYRASVFNSLEKRYTEYVMGGGSDDLFDTPVVKKGFWRLSTPENYTYHMGNVLEDWMFDEVSKLSESKNINFQLPKVKAESKLAYWLKSKIFGKFILNKKILRQYLLFKGFKSNELKNYLT